ncbi:unnamed protein product [Arabidopsis halleri]
MLKVTQRKNDKEGFRFQRQFSSHGVFPTFLRLQTLDFSSEGCSEILRMRSFQRYKDHLLLPCGVMGNRS